ncbi:carbonic anhydrase [Streptomyces sporangiiformans]|uniref:carbonic anhydrase n=1 Tax=Streptomyces sporangiiformans TaxID=2315329 RepID=UPI001F089DB1|nr:carbonic anhydrase [Streptomyces sporangiiformans]
MNPDLPPHRAVGLTSTASAGRVAPARRSLLRAALTGTAALGAGLAVGAPSAAAATPTGSTRPRPTTAQEALRELAAGNLRWRTYRERHPDESPAVRQALTTGQHPFAVVLGCIDSRVPPELVFDQGLGDLMTVRSAGEVLDEAVLGSIAYGVLELGIPLVMVLGHQSCGAVKAAVQADESGEELPAHIQYLADQISPAIDHSKEGDARIDATIDANVALVRSRLAAEPDLAAKVATGDLAIVGARYELTNQLVHRTS